MSGHGPEGTPNTVSQNEDGISSIYYKHATNTVQNRPGVSYRKLTLQ